MTCKNCGSERVMHSSGKCRDLSFCEIPHLKIDHDGYVPAFGHISGGDYIEFSVCLDCGQIPNWKPITDEMILEWKNDGMDEEDIEEDTSTSNDGAPEDSVITASTLEYNKINHLLNNVFGISWRVNAEAAELLNDELLNESNEKHTIDAIKKLLNGL